MAKIYGTPIMAGGAGGVNENLPPMITELKAAALNAQINLSWKNPRSEYLFGILIVYNTSHIPTKPNDGTKMKVGKVETATITGLTNGINYYIRLFPFNEKEQYQTILEGSYTEAIPAIGPAKVTNLQVSGSGASPVLTWENPTDDPTYHETVVIQKVDSAPTSLSDGTEIYRGTGETVTANGLEQLVNYYFGVFTVNAEGGTQGPVVSEVYRYDFPEPPTSYIEVTRLNNSETWIVPENGYFKFIGVAKSGDGGSGVLFGINRCGGGSGGSGGITVSILKLYKGQEIQLTINTYTTVVKFGDLNAISRAGGNGFTSTDGDGGKGGTAGSAEGGNQDNIAGKPGNKGNSLQITGSTAFGGFSVTTSYQKYSTTSGYGGSCSDYGQAEEPGKGTNGYVAVLRGNTNIASPSQVSELSLIPKNASMEVNWQDSGDPVQTGTTLVYSTEHIPTSPTDGTSIDVPVVKAKSTENKQSQTLSGLENGKPVFVALFPYDKDKKYGLAKQEVEIPREHSWYDKQQELEAEVESVKAEMADYQSYYTTTQEVLK